MGWVVYEVTGSSVLLAPLSGVAADRFPRQRLLQASQALAAAVSFAVGAAEMAHTASNMATLQMSAPEAMRGRIASLTMLYPAMISTGAFLAGPLSDFLGVRGASLALALASITAVAVLCVTAPHIREMRLK